MGCLVNILINTLVLSLTGLIFTGFELENLWAALIAGLLLAVVNAIVRPILVALTLPVTILTLGIFIFVINAALLMLIAWVMGGAFVIDGFGTAILAAVVIAILNALISVVLKPVRA
ncbi:phage holin family protein [Natribacillus halophilus]|uniref:Putative membrane protein n=1 Tax=Natribacillus halophilus TaxID=549003 RepID=A0A1G8KM56_9BACI|nr:phage holin family protein [Natribacillus halophilus]SDI44531.1 putative membrane protein [Natribacillus halophilus]